MTYGAETWLSNHVSAPYVTMGLLKKIKITQKKNTEKAILGVTLCDPIRNEETRRGTKVTGIARRIAIDKMNVINNIAKHLRDTI